MDVALKVPFFGVSLKDLPPGKFQLHFEEVSDAEARKFVGTSVDFRNTATGNVFVGLTLNRLIHVGGEGAAYAAGANNQYVVKRYFMPNRTDLEPEFITAPCNQASSVFPPTAKNVICELVKAIRIDGTRIMLDVRCLRSSR
eukprot:TRINITY_DN4481_c0_g1_i1.p1 TRINITY_DN4481_c0_g1~~TRINITY_DN4481_c0_g1_i1.p1  ORF type:complete len:150 (+),score=18.45 TRINITY_DN4481_c0_g1_i1:27-452(+)